MSTTIEKTILSNLLNNEEYCRRVVPFVMPEYFPDAVEGMIADELLKFFNEYNQLPTLEILGIQLSNREKSDQSQANKLETYINSLDFSTPNMEWLLKETEAFCRKRAITNAILDSYYIIEGKDKKRTEEAIPEMVANALAVCFDTSVGHDYLEDYEARFEFYHKTEEKIPFDIELLNKITKGGLSKKTLNVVLGGPKSGKSMMLCHIAASTLLQKKNVLYITLEMAEERIAERIDSNLLDVTIDELYSIRKESYMSRIQGLIKKTTGRLVIKEYPTTSAHVGHFKSLLSELRIKKDFVPDMIIVDYLNICASSRLRMGGNVNSYSLIKSITEELRGLAVEFNVPILSATQTNRCLGLNTVIETINGPIEIKDVHVGDKILSNDGYVTVENVFPIEKNITYEIKTKSGKTILCSGKHIFPTTDGEKSILAGLKVGDFLFVRK